MIFYFLLLTLFTLFSFFAWRRLPLAVLFVIATLPSYLIRFQLGPIPMTLLEGMILIVVVVWLLRQLRAKGLGLMVFETLRSTLYALRWPLGLFLLAATISMFVAPDLRAAAGIWKAYFVEPILFFLVVKDLIQSRVTRYGLRVTQIITALSLTAIFLSLYAIYQRFTGFGIPPPWDIERRVTSIFPYPNALALFLGPLVPLFVARLLAQFRHSERSEESRAHARKLFAISYWLLATITSILAIIFAKSTGALIGVVSGLIVMGLLVLGAKAHERVFYHAKRFYVRITIAVLAALAAFTVLAPPSLKDELLLRNWPGHVRRTQWTETVEMLKDRPIWGAGLAGYKETLAPYHKATYLEIFEYPHNIVLNFWSETGLLGVLAFTWLIIVFFRHTFRGLEIRNWKLAIPVMASMIVILIHGLVDVPYFKNDLAILFWIVYALGVVNSQTPYASSNQTLQTH